MPKMEESELVAILAAEKADALSADDAAKLSAEREKAMDYYNGDMTSTMPSQPDRSKAVSHDVADTVDGLMPGLMEIFCGGDEVVKFNPVGPEDEPLAEQESDYINHVFMQKNEGFLITYSFVKDALLSKNGIVKIFWEEREDEERETFLDQPDDVYALLAADESIDIVEHTEHPETIPGYGATHDVTVVRKREYGCCKIEPVPPEEFGVSRRAKLGQPLDYSYHQVQRTQAQLIAQGFDEDQVKDLPDSPSSQNTEDAARDTVEDDRSQASNVNKANRLITVTEHYAMLDYEGDGKAALYRVTTAGSDKGQVLKRDGKPDITREDFDPFAVMTPNIVTHRFFGKSIADLVMDIQEIDTALLRGILDNTYLANNQRIEISESHAGKDTIDDLLNNRPGGLVRTKTPGGLLPIPNQNLGEFVFPVLEYMDTKREWRTGVVKQGQGIDADALQNQSATAVNKVYSAAQAKQKLIARIMAETGFRQMFWKTHATVRKNEGSRPTAKLRNKWVTVNPREWRRRDDLTISVGLGSGGKTEQMVFWGQVLNMQKEAILVPGQTVVKPKNIYNSFGKFLEAGGEKSVELYFSDPDQQPPAPPPPDPKMIEAEGKLKIEEAKLQAGAQADQGKMQIEIGKAKAKLDLDRQKMQAEAVLGQEKMQAEARMKQQQMQAEYDLKLMQMRAEFDLRLQEMDVDAELERESIHVNAEVKKATTPVRMGGKVG
jgi:hypothetical protein